VYKVLLLLLIGGNAHAFPEMIRHNYINCTTCHVAPSGGGLLTPYGRSLSKELLSTWSYQGEENLGHGLIQDEKVLNWVNGNQDVGFNFGGDVRYIDVYQNTSAVRASKFFPMEREVEGAFKVHNLTLVSTFGPQYDPNGPDKFDTRRYYAMYQVHETTSVRIGRFMPVYGLMIPDHYTNVKTGLGFGEGMERDSAEVNFIKDNWNATLTYTKSPKHIDDAQEEHAFAAQANYTIRDHYKFGASYWNGETDTSRRAIYGVQGMLGFTPKLYFLNEIDYQVRDTGATETKGIYYYEKLGYEFYRGMHVFLQTDGGQPAFADEKTKSFAYGAGLDFFPRPHFQFQGLWSKMSIHFPAKDNVDFAYLLMHYYF